MSGPVNDSGYFPSITSPNPLKKLHKNTLSLTAFGLLIVFAAVACGDADPADLDPASVPTQVVVDLPTATSEPEAAVTPTPVPKPTNPLPLPTYQDGVLELYGIDSWINSDPFTISCTEP